MRWSVLVDGVRYYRPERLKQHAEIQKALLSGSVRRPAGRAAVIAGGPASGKSSIVSKLALPPRAVHIDADAIKEQLPEYRELVKLGDEQAAYVVHEESADIARAVFEDAIARNRHLILDAVGDSEPGKFAGKLQRLVDAGYAVHVVYVDVSVEEEDPRATARQRVVPEAVIRMLHREVAARFPEVEALGLASLRIFATGTEGASSHRRAPGRHVAQCPRRR